MIVASDSSRYSSAVHRLPDDQLLLTKFTLAQNWKDTHRHIHNVYTPLIHLHTTNDDHHLAASSTRFDFI